MYGYESWIIKKAESWRIDAFELWSWKTHESPLDRRRSNQSNLKEVNPECSLEGLMLKLKLQYLGHLMWRANSLEKTLILGKIERRRRGWQRMRWFSSVTQSCLTLCDPMDCNFPGFPVHYQLPEFAQTHVHWVGDAIQPSHPLSSPSPAFHLTQCQGLFKESVLCIRWPKYWSFSISPSSEHSGLISFRIDWLDLLAVQGTVSSLL